jgi:hypothetical protein
MRRAPLILIAALVGTVSGCDPATRLSGSVLRDDGSPVPGATVRTVCPNQSGAMSAVADEAGRISAQGLGCVHDGCRLELIVPEHAPKVLPFKNYCTDAALVCHGACSRLDVNVKVP